MIDRNKYILTYCWLWLLFHLVRIVDGLCLSCLAQPFLYDPRQDPLLWFVQYLDIPRWLVDHYWLTVAFDLGLPLILIIILIKAGKNSRLLWICFIACFWVYLLMIFSFPSLSIRKYLGFAIVPLVFIIPKEYYFKGLAFLRYFCLFIFSSSALWKILRGSIFETDHFYNIIRNQHFSNFLHYPDHWISKLNLFLLDYPNFLHLSFVLVVLAQLSFVVGFFTHRYDKILFVLMIAFVFMDYAVMRIEYWEFAVLLPLLWYRSTGIESK